MPVYGESHGGIDFDQIARLGFAPQEIANLSENVLPVPPAPRVLQALAETPISQYPDRECLALRKALGDHHNLAIERIFVGNGCTELIHLVARVISRRTSRKTPCWRVDEDLPSPAGRPVFSALIVGPTFSEYQRAVELMEGKVKTVLAVPETNFAVPLQEVQEELARSWDSVWICNPNNPTAQSIPREVLVAWITDNPQTLFVIDESYAEFALAPQSVLNFEAENLIVLRSMTKAFALPGLRLGYLVAPPKFQMELRDVQQPWSVNAMAQSAGVAALQEHAYYSKAIHCLHVEKERFVTELNGLGWKPVPSDVGFFLIDVVGGLEGCLNTGDGLKSRLTMDGLESRLTMDGLESRLTMDGLKSRLTMDGLETRPSMRATEWRGRLLQRGVLVRNCCSFGLPNFLRVAVGTREANQRLLKAVKDLGEVTTGFPSLSMEIGVQPVSPRMFFPPVKNERRTSQQVENPFDEQLQRLFRMRRDVRHFRQDAVPEALLAECLEAACQAPSVGLSQPWRFVSVKSAEVRGLVIQEFSEQNRQAAVSYPTESERSKYASLKLEGLREAPEQIAVLIEPDPQKGRGLGRRTMPETVAYSVVAAIQNFWLLARSRGLGVGWVSIFRPERLVEVLSVPKHWQLIAYLCIGFPQNPEEEVPELERVGWERRGSQVWLRR
jgi:5,6-dimethylbenzimidazole synthase